MPEREEPPFQSVHALARLWRELRSVRAEALAAGSELRARIERLEDELDRLKEAIEDGTGPDAM